MQLSVSEIDGAIRQVLTGQSYTLPDGTSVTRADLDKLRVMRQELLAEQQAASRKGSIRKIGFGSPS